MNIIVARTKEVELIERKIGFEGFVTVQLIHAKTGFIKFESTFKNLIVDAGLNYLGTSAQRLSNLLGSGYIAVGTGSTAPGIAQTALVTELGANSRTNSDGGISATTTFGPSNSYIEATVTREYTEAQAIGNLTELGMFSAAAAGTMLFRQLFKDGVGAPTVISKTAAERLRIIYKFRIYPPADVTSTVTISGVVYDYTTRALNIDDNNAWGATGSTLGTGGMLSSFGTWTNFRSEALESNALIIPTNGGVGTVGTTTLSAYTLNNFYRDMATEWAAGTANFATGIGSVLLNASTASGTVVFQTAFITTKVPKTNVDKFTFNQRVSWGRYP